MVQPPLSFHNQLLLDVYCTCWQAGLKGQGDPPWAPPELPGWCEGDQRGRRRLWQLRRQLLQIQRTRQARKRSPSGPISGRTLVPPEAPRTGQQCRGWSAEGLGLSPSIAPAAKVHVVRQKVWPNVSNGGAHLTAAQAAAIVSKLPKKMAISIFIKAGGCCESLIRCDNQSTVERIRSQGQRVSCKASKDRPSMSAG